ncbi:glycosyltransferase family 4 protein [Bifidobacterium sp.]|jgi:phosphatidylinositol alpha-mannosyltransferase|uniref:glycosyltransferase family 4 protein n=1 Tax=Bifidobacterium sp. TaxID=41200 RepID=UPI0025BE1379|nr:glycosyltransferase family 4 protein [Bifidobacterium sp.]MCI1635744.1 glycosyltransferase family 4 protein [Bifidobacterium sp.]
MFVDSQHSASNDSTDPLDGRKLKVGIISPYSFETPGGVQLHIRDFAKQLIARGHDVEVLAPGRRTHDMPLWVQTTGSSFAIPYNGSVANLSYFGWVGSTTRRWVKQGHFDIVHLHEPEVPSISHKPLIPGFDPCPYVATFHASFDTYPLALKCTQLYLRSYLSNIRAAICVSDSALETASHYLDPATDISVIPNGINTASFAAARTRSEWLGTPSAPTIGFLGRMGEDRKGFAVFARAASLILEHIPHARFLCVGDGEADGRKILSSFSEELLAATEFLGRISDDDKAEFYKSLTVYVAPQIGGESFGIVLAEAMAAGCATVASDLKAFKAVSKEGTAAKLFTNGDAHACADAVIELVSNDSARTSLCTRGEVRARDYDWSEVTRSVLSIYAKVLASQ